MPKYSQSEGTPAGGGELEGWALKLPFLADSHGAFVQLKGKQPSWHPMIHFVGYAGIARTALTAVTPPVSTAESVLVYAGCIVVALITGKLVKSGKSERFPRIASATLGTVAFTMAVIAAQISIHHPAPRGGWPELVAPLSAAGFMIMLNVVGEVLTRWRSRRSRPGQTGPQQTGPGPTGPRQTGPGPTGPRQTGPRQTGPRQPRRRQPRVTQKGSTARNPMLSLPQHLSPVEVRQAS